MNMVIIAGFSRSGKSELRRRLCAGGRFRMLPFKQIRLFSQSLEDIFAQRQSEWARAIAEVLTQKGAAGRKEAENRLREMEEEFKATNEHRPPPNPLKCEKLTRMTLGLLGEEWLTVDSESAHERDFWQAVLNALEPDDRCIFVLLETSFDIYNKRRAKAAEGGEPRKDLGREKFDKMHADAAEQFPRKDAGFIHRIRCRVGLPRVASKDDEQMLECDTDEEYREQGSGDVVEAVFASFKPKE